MDLTLEEWAQSEVYLSGFDVLIGDDCTTRVRRPQDVDDGQRL